MSKQLEFASLDSLEGALPESSRIAANRGYFGALRALAPGLSIVGLIALAASWLSDHYGAPVMLFALLLGLAVNFTSKEKSCRPGIDFAARTILRTGVALLGARITLIQVQSLGGGVLVVVTAAVVLTIVSGYFVARRLKLSADFGVLTGGSVAICGASAALAIASVLPKSLARERDTILTVVGVTTLSTVAMVAYPVLAQSLGLNDNAAGVFLGATIHDVAQVVGAGYSLSRDTGDTATLVKLFRVALLLPTVAVISLIFHSTTANGGTTKRPPLVPGFLAGFAALVVVNSSGVVADSVMNWLSMMSRWCLVVAISALGTKTALGDFVHVGWRPIILIVAETAVIGLFIGAIVVIRLAN